MRIQTPSLMASSRQKTGGAFGIIDIGSNSVRLVVYASLSRNPVPIFNEKVMAGLGRGLAESGHLNPEGVERALEALKRFRRLARELSVGELQVTATAAVREAEDGDLFARRVEETCGRELTLISGEEEARLAALGVLSGIPDARGLVGDLGGGSLELIPVADGVMGKGVTLPLGPLRLEPVKEQGEDLDRYVSEIVSRVDWLSSMEGQSLYVVGGVWRNLARIHMAHVEYPVRILHEYAIPAGDAQQLAGLIEHLGSQSLSKIPDISMRRISALPYGALVLDKVIQASRVKEVVVSAYGLREGVLFDALPRSEREEHPLLAGCRDLASRLVRYPDHGDELERWTSTLFCEQETSLQKRLRHAACILADVGWFAHPDYRSAHALELILFAPVSGIDHQGRAFLARAGYYRHGGGKGSDLLQATRTMLTEEDADRARILGTALRLSFVLCAARPGVLPLTGLKIEGDQLVLRAERSVQDLIGETVEKRLSQLARLLDRTPHIDIV